MLFDSSDGCVISLGTFLIHLVCLYGGISPAPARPASQPRSSPPEPHLWGILGGGTSVYKGPILVTSRVRTNSRWKLSVKAQKPSQALSVLIELGALIGFYSCDSHHALAGKASWLTSQGRKQKHRKAGDLTVPYLLKEQSVDLNSQLFVSRVSVFSTTRLSHHPEGF